MAPDFRSLLNGERLLSDLKALASYGALQEGGISRPAFSPALQSASDWLVRRMKDAGLSTRIDAAGNIIGRIGPAGPAVLCGSHIDTVPGGGHLDGALGVLAGLECARALGLSGLQLRHALEIVAFSDEEGAYVSLFGSRAMMGELGPDTLRSPGFAELSKVMTAVGMDPSRIIEAARHPSEIRAYIELHIEQGPVLEDANVDVGVVDSIVGMDFVRYRLMGEARHAGSTPMNMRRDAGRGACAAVTAAFKSLENSGLMGARMTFGEMRFLPGASNVVPAQALVSSEVRSGSADTLRTLRLLVDTAFKEAASQHGLALDRENPELDEAAPLDAAIIAVIEDTAAEMGLKALRMPSGACHDAQIAARRVPTGMIFVPSRSGISHHPDEFSPPGALVTGAELLVCTLAKLVVERDGV